MSPRDSGLSCWPVAVTVHVGEDPGEQIGFVFGCVELSCLPDIQGEMFKAGRKGAKGWIVSLVTPARLAKTPRTPGGCGKSRALVLRPQQPGRASRETVGAPVSAIGGSPAERTGRNARRARCCRKAR